MSNASEYNTRLLASTLDRYEKTLRDNILDRDKVLGFFKQKAMDKVKGGKRLAYSQLINTNSNFASYADDDEIAISRQDPFTQAVYAWRQYGGSVALTGIELFKNGSSDAKIIDMLSGHLEQLEKTVADTLSSHIFTAQTGANMNGMPDLLDASGSNSTVGGINSSTYAYWQNVKSTVPGNTFGNTANGDGMATIRKVIRLANKTRKPKRAIFSSSDIVGYIEESMVDALRYSTSDKESSFSDIMVKGHEVIDDSNVATGNIFLPSLEDIRLVVGEGADFKLDSQAREPINQDMKVWMYKTYLNLVAKSRRNSARISGITGVS